MEDIQQKINHFFQDLKFAEKQHRYTVGSNFLPSVRRSNTERMG